MISHKIAIALAALLACGTVEAADKLDIGSRARLRSARHGVQIAPGANGAMRVAPSADAGHSDATTAEKAAKAVVIFFI